VAKRKGYVSSFDREGGYGFLLPADAPKEKILFRREAVSDDDARTLMTGMEVLFEVNDEASASNADPWQVARSVEIVTSDDSEAASEMGGFEAPM
jgi:cold shock CspA family protein